jgi:hypothetical protein
VTESVAHSTNAAENVSQCKTSRRVKRLGADGFAVDASLIAADANKQRSVPSREWKPEEIKETATRAAQEYLATLDERGVRSRIAGDAEVHLAIRSGGPMDRRT